MEYPVEALGPNLSLKEMVYENLRNQIITGKLAPGMRLPEEELSRAMNISRAPIREALNMLHRDGFATIIPRRGAIVSLITPEDIRDNWEIRELLEPYGAKVSTPRIPDEEIDNMYNRINALLNGAESFQEYVQSDLDLHEMFFQYVTNRQLREVLMTTKAHSLRMRYYAENGKTPREDVIKEATQEHLVILDTLRKRDPEKVFQAVLAHIRAGRDRAERAHQE